MQSAGWKKQQLKMMKGHSVSMKKVEKLWPKKEQDLLEDTRSDGDLPACNLYLFPPFCKQRQESLFLPLQPGLLLYWHREAIKQQGKSFLEL